MKRGLVVAGAVAAVVLLGGCIDASSVVDSKAELNLPDGKGTCYMLEIDQQSGGGADAGENFYCVPKAEWDKNKIGEEWVDASGKKK